MLMLRIQVIYPSSFEVTVLRAHPSGVLASSVTLILLLREERGRKFNPGSHDLIYHVSKALEIFWLPASFSGHFTSSLVCVHQGPQ